MQTSNHLIWELVRNHHSFLRKGVNHSKFSAEPGNLYNKHSFKYSGLSQDKTIDISVDPEKKEVEVNLTKARKSMAQKPAKRLHKKVLKRDPRRMQKAVAAEALIYRKDLQRAAMARIGAECKQLKYIRQQGDN